MVQNLLLALAASPLMLSHALSIARRDSKPNLPYDPNTSKYCSWWVDWDGSKACAQMLEDEWTNDADFRRWNPTIGANCTNIVVGNSYCVEARDEPPFTPTPTPTPTPSSSTIRPPPTTTPKPSTTNRPPPLTSSTTSAGNGITTPLPTQPTIAPNCDKFYFVQAEDHCADIAAQYGITLAKFLAWNPSAGSSCAGLWAQAYACVSIIGEDATPIPSATPTPTNPGNGISTPQPTQPNMVGNCDKFYFVQKGEGCAAIASANGMSLTQFLNWNPSAGSDCKGLWGEAYACVSIIGHTPTTPTPTPTKPPNGVQTPSPTQPGMVSNCKKFDFVKKDEGCAVVAQRNGISVANFTKWNTGVGSDCRSMWAESYVCVGV